MIGRRLIRLSAAAAAALVLSATALAAQPKKGATYKGVLGGGIAKEALLAVSASGTTARFVWWCGTGRAPIVVRGVSIGRDGRFKAGQKVGTQVTWAMAGRFVSPTQAYVSLKAVTECGGLGGSGFLKLAPAALR